MTKLCLGPKDGVKKPAQNTQIVISKHCNTKFDVINEGVLQLVGSGMCVHPLWGGDSPEEGQKLCLYPDCEAQKRLQFRWFFAYDKGMILVDQFTTSKMNTYLSLYFRFFRFDISCICCRYISILILVAVLNPVPDLRSIS